MPPAIDDTLLASGVIYDIGKTTGVLKSIKYHIEPLRRQGDEAKSSVLYMELVRLSGGCTMPNRRVGGAWINAWRLLVKIPG